VYFLTEHTREHLCLQDPQSRPTARQILSEDILKNVKDDEEGGDDELREENRLLKEEVRLLKEENRNLKIKGEKEKEENMLLKEENKNLKMKVGMNLLKKKKKKKMRI
jgi:hypothetical protein